MKKRFISLIILIITVTFIFTGCESEPKVDSKEIGIVEVMNKSSNTVTVTINKETKILASNISKVWRISVNNYKIVSCKLESNDGRTISEGEITIRGCTS